MDSLQIFGFCRSPTGRFKVLTEWTAGVSKANQTEAKTEDVLINETAYLQLALKQHDA